MAILIELEAKDGLTPAVEKARRAVEGHFRRMASTQETVAEKAAEGVVRIQREGGERVEALFRSQGDAYEEVMEGRVVRAARASVERQEQAWAGLGVSAEALFGGIEAGAREAYRKMSDLGGNAAAATAGTFDALRGSLQEEFFNFLTGNFESLGDSFRGMGERMLRLWVDLIARMVTAWAASGLASLFGFPASATPGIAAGGALPGAGAGGSGGFFQSLAGSAIGRGVVSLAGTLFGGGTAAQAALAAGTVATEGGATLGFGTAAASGGLSLGGATAASLLVNPATVGAAAFLGVPAIFDALGFGAGGLSAAQSAAIRAEPEIRRIAERELGRANAIAAGLEEPSFVSGFADIFVRNPTPEARRRELVNTINAPLFGGGARNLGIPIEAVQTDPRFLGQPLKFEDLPLSLFDFVSAAHGIDLTTTRPTLIRTSEFGQRERVRVEPEGRGGDAGAGGVSIHIDLRGSVVASRREADRLAARIEAALRRRGRMRFSAV